MGVAGRAVSTGAWERAHVSRAPQGTRWTLWRHEELRRREVVGEGPCEVVETPRGSREAADAPETRGRHKGAKAQCREGAGPHTLRGCRGENTRASRNRDTAWGIEATMPHRAPRPRCHAGRRGCKAQVCRVLHDKVPHLSVSLMALDSLGLAFEWTTQLALYSAAHGAVGF